MGDIGQVLAHYDVLPLHEETMVRLEQPIDPTSVLTVLPVLPVLEAQPAESEPAR